MICLDSDAAIAAFQKDPPENIASLREKVLHFMREQGSMRVMFPSVALSEYVWRADLADLRAAIQKVVGGTMFTPGFNDSTAIVAADLGRKYSKGGKLTHFLKQLSYDRVGFKADLLIVAIAVEHQPKFFLTRDDNCHKLATFAGLNSRLITELPDPPPTEPARPSPQPAPGTRQLSILDLADDFGKSQDEESKPDE